MLLHLILGFVALLAVSLAAGLLVVVIGIQRGDHGRRLTGRPVGRAEVFARWMLTGYRGCGSSQRTGGHQ